MITTEENNIHRKVPFLGDIPLLGRLFRYDRVATARKELLIFLTPQSSTATKIRKMQKAIEMQRVQINMDKAMQMHGPLLEQHRHDENGVIDLAPEHVVEPMLQPIEQPE